MSEIERESMEFDVVIVGGGPAGLAAACYLKKRALESEEEISVVVLEKGSEIGAHILSGAVFEPTALTELFPDWQDRNAPLNTEVSEDQIYFVTSAQKAIKFPNWASPKTMHNKGNYIISLGNFCRWLAEQAEALGVEIFPGFPAADVLYNDDGSVKGVVTGDMGVGRDGQPKDGFEPGMELHAKYTLFAEGCRGHLGKQLIRQYNLAENSKQPQHYGIGIKELWTVPDDNHQPGLVVHGTGWPLSENDASGGFFLYHLEDNQVAVGLITALNYSNPHLSPYDEFQRFKHHPIIAKTLTGGERISYGARALNKGGLNSLPKMTFPGGLLIGCDAGTLNFSKIKGTHTAMKSGMIAAECVFERLKNGDKGGNEVEEFTELFEASWAYKELYTSRNFGSALHKWGPYFGGAYNFIDQLIGGKLPFTMLEQQSDHEGLELASDADKIDYPKPDGILSFDKTSSVFLSATNHEEDQPIHLTLTNTSIPIEVNLSKWNEPAQRYCPAGVYEVVNDAEGARFQINAQNCVHCKTCDIKDPSQNINWVTPEGAGGPNYPNM